MHIKLTEYIRATTLTLNIKDAPMTALPLIKDAFAKLATDLEEMMGPDMQRECGVITWRSAADVMQPVADFTDAQKVFDLQNSKLAETLAAEKPRRGRPPKVKVEEPAPVEPTPLEQAITEAQEGQDSPGETSAPAAESLEAPLSGATTASNMESSLTSAAPESESPATPANPVSDSDLQKYCVKLAQHYGGPQKVFDLAKPFVEEGAVPRPSNIKGDDKRWQFIKAVEADSGVRYVG